jgi:cellulose synthase/poly-beta-1,6-N-acetylglucosamine synthase-like glycosyltransferase
MGILLQKDPWSTAVRKTLPTLIPLGLLGLWRWSMFLFRVVGWFFYKPQPPSPLDKFKTSDVTLVIPTIDTDEEAMHEAMRSWVLNEPAEIIIVTVGEGTQKELKRIAATSIAADITRVLRVEGRANKRIQLVLGIKAARTPLVCFTDDDAIWNANFLRWLLVPFNDPRMGGTGSNQIMRPNDLTKPPTVFERIADMRLSGRMLEAAASTFYDGSVSCLSGRTALYHKRILTDSFAQEFTEEKWRNKYQLISGDDKFMTRWIVKHDWNMSMQISPECTLATTFKADGKFFMQILRWTRNTWRSDCKSLILERNIWNRYPVQAVLMCDRMISPFTLMSGPILFMLSLILIRNFESWRDVVTALCIYILWVLVSRTLRMLPHFYRCPEDITYLFYFVIYQYYFAMLKLYALFTLHVTAWGSRVGVGAPDKKDTRDEIDDVEKELERLRVEEAKQAKKEEVRVRMVKRDHTAQKTYQKGKIALMRRIHRQRQDDEVEQENLRRAQMAAAPYFGSPWQSQFSSQTDSSMPVYSNIGPMYNVGSPVHNGGSPVHNGGSPVHNIGSHPGAIYAAR